MLQKLMWKFGTIYLLISRLTNFQKLGWKCARVARRADEDIQGFFWEEFTD